MKQGKPLIEVLEPYLDGSEADKLIEYLDNKKLPIQAVKTSYSRINQTLGNLNTKQGTPISPLKDS